MENNVTFPQLKLTSRRNKFLILVSILVGISFIVIITLPENSCGIRHMMIIRDLNTQDNIETEYCEHLIEKIDLFNEQCEPYIEILDCG